MAILIIVLLMMMSCPFETGAAPNSTVNDIHLPHQQQLADPARSPVVELQKPTSNASRATDINQASSDTNHNSNSAPRLAAATTTNQLRTNNSEQMFLGGICREKSSCIQRRRDLKVDKQSCYCDHKCAQYDDCCHNSKWASSLKRRAELGSSELRKTRNQWLCHRINPVFGDVLLKATCRPDWLTTNRRISVRQLELAKLVQKRCEYVRNSAKLSDSERAAHDPVGMMMPITDLTSGITFANSYCLRCNKQDILSQVGNSTNATEATNNNSNNNDTPKLIYWTPMLECNYDLDSDDRNTLYDLLSTRRGEVLKYSSKLNKWLIEIEQAKKQPASERVCSITPTIPDSVEHMIRYCRAKSIDTCLAGRQLNEHLTKLNSSELVEFERAKQDCEFGHQALTFSLQSDSVYYNLGCAKCNLERQLFCEPRMRKTSADLTPNKQIIRPIGGGQTNNTSGDKILNQAPEAPIGLDNESGRSGKHGSASKATLSVLFDFGSSHGDEQVGVVHQCHDPQSQIWDPFLLVCRDMIPRMSCMQSAHQQIADSGKCAYVASQTMSEQQAEVVDKFKPAMVYTTTVCLIISIASLSTYLLLYCLSMFDLRHLVVDMAQHSAQIEQQQQQQQHESRRALNKLSSSPLDKFHRCRNSNETNMSMGGNTAAKSHSLSSRGVACLASSLLAAYLLFIVGHRPVDEQEDEQPDNLLHELGNKQPALACLAIAVATYYCFLLSFHWMFLLSYDIWRTLRLATCHLRGPAMHSQSKRFLSYMLFAFLSSALIVGTSIVFDLASIECSPASGNETGTGKQQWLDNQALRRSLNLSSVESTTTQCDRNQPLESELIRFVQNYKPKFGERTGSCWFSNRRSLALFFGLPVALIMLANLLFFIHSSYMVLKTSGRSSRHFSSSGGSSPNSSISKPNLLAAYQKNSAPLSSRRLDSSASSTTSDGSCTTSSTSNGPSSISDYAQQNSFTAHSLTSVQTLQSHLSASSAESPSSSSAEEQQVAADNNDQDGEQVADEANDQLGPLDGVHEQAIGSGKIQRKLEPSQSSSSLTNQSIGGASISASLAMKYDSLGSLMSRIVKDYRLYCRLSTIMGLTWLTGLVASLVDQSALLWYLFVVLNTLQGLFIFIAFGCKRSKLDNVEILINYLNFRIRTSRFGKSNSTSSSEPTNANKMDDEKLNRVEQKQNHILHPATSKKAAANSVSAR